MGCFRINFSKKPSAKKSDYMVKENDVIIKNDIIILILNRFEYIIKNIGKNTKIKPNIISITINNNGYLWNIPKEWAKNLLNLDLDLTFFNINGIFSFWMESFKVKVSINEDWFNDCFKFLWHKLSSSTSIYLKNK